MIKVIKPLSNNFFGLLVIIMSKNNYKYEIVSESSDNVKIVEIKTGDTYSSSKSVKGAVIGALAIGIRLNTIDFNNNWVPVGECLQAVR